MIRRIGIRSLTEAIIDIIDEKDWKKVLLSPGQYMEDKYGIPKRSITTVKKSILKKRPEWRREYEDYVDNMYINIPHDKFEEYMALTYREAKEIYGFSRSTYSHLRRDILKRRPELAQQSFIKKIDNRSVFTVPSSEYEKFIALSPSERRNLGITRADYNRQLKKIFIERPELEDEYRKKIKLRAEPSKVREEEYEKFLSITPAEARKYYNLGETKFFTEKKRILNERPDLREVYSFSYNVFRKYKITPADYGNVVLISPYRAEEIYGIPWRQHRRVRNRIFLDRPDLEAKYHDTKIKQILKGGKESSEVSVPPSEYERFLTLSRKDAVELYSIHDAGHSEYVKEIKKRLGR